MSDTNNNFKIKPCTSTMCSDIFNKFYTLIFSLLTLILLSHTSAAGAEINGPEVRVQDNEIHVTTSLALDDQIFQELRNGMTKEFRFYVDLFRPWKMLPDEFILGKSFTRTLKSDPVKKEYVALSGDGNILIQKRFKSLESMIQWALTINDMKLANVKELEPSVYYVRVTVESRIRQKPPVIGYFMIFLPENEFKITKASPLIPIGKVR
jgi:hypothetical protein